MFGVKLLPLWDHIWHIWSSESFWILIGMLPPLGSLTFCFSFLLRNKRILSFPKIFCYIELNSILCVLIDWCRQLWFRMDCRDWMSTLGLAELRCSRRGRWSPPLVWSYVLVKGFDHWWSLFPSIAGQRTRRGFPQLDTFQAKWYAIIIPVLE